MWLSALFFYKSSMQFSKFRSKLIGIKMCGVLVISSRNLRMSYGSFVTSIGGCVAGVAGIHVMPVTRAGWRQYEGLITEGRL
jgi:hypothetical protein